MNYKKIVLFVLGLLVSFSGLSQVPKERNQENINVNKFRQLYQEFSSPNMFRTASGAPGPAYYQQQADYKMDIELDDGWHLLTAYRNYQATGQRIAVIKRQFEAY